jgi:hypothetical protein
MYTLVEEKEDGFVLNIELLQYVITAHLVSSRRPLSTLLDLPFYGFFLFLFLIPGVLNAPNYEDCNNSSRGSHNNPNFPRCVLEAKYQQSNEESPGAV